MKISDKVREVKKEDLIMPIVIKSAGDSLVVYDPDVKAKVGRWCAAPFIPDLCDTCFNPKTLAHHKANGYREETAPDGTVWRYGTCHRCIKGKKGAKGVQLK